MKKNKLILGLLLTILVASFIFVIRNIPFIIINGARIYVLIFLISILAIIFMSVYNTDNKIKRVISYVLSFAIILSSVFSVFAINLNANSDKKSFIANKIITVSKQEYDIQANISYADSNDNQETDISQSEKTEESENKEIEIKDFKADIFDILVGEEIETTFTAKVYSDFELSDKDILIYDTEGNTIGYLNDTGTGNKLFGYRIFTYTTILSSDKRENINYYAKYNNSKSNNFEICYYEKISEDNFILFQNMMSDVQALEKNMRNSNSSDDDIMNSVYDYLQAVDFVTVALIDKETKSISIKTSFGISGVWELKGKDTIGSTNTFSRSNYESQELSLKEINLTLQGESVSKINEIVIICPYENIDENFWIDSYNFVAGVIAEYTGANLTTVYNENVSLEFLKTLNNYDLILFYSHGILSSALDFTGPLPYKNPYTMTGEFAEFKDILASADFQNERIIIDISDERLGIGSKFYDKYYSENSLKDSFFHFGSCHSMKNYTIADSLIDKGASWVEGYSGSVHFSNDYAHLQYIMAYLSEGFTIQESIQEALKLDEVQKHHQDDCELRYRGDINYIIIEKNHKMVEFAGGNGTEENPYQVATAEQLNAVRYDLSAHYIQINDIDLSGYSSWEPIGNANDVFSGSYNGQNYEINNMSIIVENNADNMIYNDRLSLGLFGELDRHCRIENIKLKNVLIDVHIEGSENMGIYVGGIAGYSEHSGTSFTTKVEHCSVDGSINIKVSDISDGCVYTGGIVVSGNVENCINKVDISIESSTSVYAGGINVFGNVTKSINHGDINVITTNAGINAGGINGCFYSGYIIEHCVNYGNINGKIMENRWNGSFLCEVGGIKSSNGTISNCINYGNVTGIYHNAIIVYYTGSCAGGIVGKTASVKNCYNLGYNILSGEESQSGVLTYKNAGRISGYNGGIIDSYSIDNALVNDKIPTENIGENKINGVSMTETEIQQAIQYILDELSPLM